MSFSITAERFGIKFFFFFLAIGSLWAESRCFLLAEAETGKIILQDGEGFNELLSPCSTFKIPLSLMGFDSGILKDMDDPKWEYQEAYASGLDVCKALQTPRSWMLNSCVWFSQLLTQSLGSALLTSYVTAFNYGNQDLSGDPGKNNGLTKAWLSSSLKITPLQQLEFLRKFVLRQLPVHNGAFEMTQEILFLEAFGDNGSFYGKTGTGTSEKGGYLVWLIGWIEKFGKTYLYVLNINNAQKIPSRGERCAIVKDYFSAHKGT